MIDRKIFNLHSVLLSFFIYLVILSVASKTGMFIWSLTEDQYLVMDFIPQLVGAKIIADGRGPDLYDLSVQQHYQKNVFENTKLDFILPFRNLPTGAFLYLVFVPFDIKAGYLAFAIINILLVGVFVSILFHKSRKEALFFLVVTFAYAPFYFTLLFGQSSAVLLLILTGVLLCMKRGKYVPAGVLAALLLLKFNYLLLLPLLLVSLDKAVISEFLKGFIPTMLVLLLINYAIAGNALMAYPDFLRETESEKFGTYPGHIYSSERLTEKFFGETLSYVIKFPLYLFFLGLIYRLRDKYTHENLWMASIYVFLFLSPHIQVQDFLITLLPMTVLFKRRNENANLFVLAMVTLTTGYFWGEMVWLNSVSSLSLALYFLLYKPQAGKLSGESFV